MSYKVLHLCGIFFVLMALGGAVLHAINSGTKSPNPGRKWIGITHGVGLLLVLVTGFGLLARLGISHSGGWPLWVWLKLAIWLALGAMIVVIGRSPRYGRFFWIVVPILAALAAYLAIHKPFDG